MRDLVVLIGELTRRIAETERRLKNTVRFGTVEDVDFKKGLVRVKDGELKTGWMPWHDAGGAIKTWTPPAKGQIAVVLSPSGDIAQGIALPGQFSDANKQPHDKGAEYRMTIGDTSILLTGDTMTVDVETLTFNTKKTTVNGKEINLKADLVHAIGAELVHNEKSVSDTHEHTEVTSGSDLTGPPK